jgi:hypothetical protein
MIRKTIEIIFILMLLLGIISASSGCTQEQEELLYLFNNSQTTATQDNYVIVDTGQNSCYDNSEEISYPEPSESFYGQDAQYYSNQPSYQDNGDGTVTDLNTGLMWQQGSEEKMTYSQAVTGASSFNLAGYNDWRLPTIKELYSLMDFRGTDPSAGATSGMIPFIDTDYFIFEYGDTSSGERIIDSQWTTSSVYRSTVMDGQEGFFGVNFADGRIKCYPTADFKLYFTRYVRGTSYGINNFNDNSDGTITDLSTGLIWQKDDNGQGILWKDALEYSENLELAGYSDWRLPNAKELQSIIDYSRCPDVTNSAAINPIFNISHITNEGGEEDYPFFWTSTTHIGYPNNGQTAVYISFGRALGYWNNHWIDVHGAGAQRSDPKTGDPSDYPYGHGPQGDAVRIYNYVRCVRGGLSDNQAPEKPETPEGTVSGETGVEYTYNTSSSDPEGDKLYYWFDWGDDTNSGWLGPYNSGDIVSSSHVWNTRGNYDIKVKAKDIDGAQSQWSDSLVISMPKSNSILTQIYQNFEEKPLITLVAGGIGITLLLSIWKVLFNMG